MQGAERPSSLGSTFAVFSPHFIHLRLFSLPLLICGPALLCSRNSFCHIKFDSTGFPVDPEEQSASVLL